MPVGSTAFWGVTKIGDQMDGEMAAAWRCLAGFVAIRGDLGNQRFQKKLSLGLCNAISVF